MKCVHHWILESPNGSWCKGKCKKCNEVGEFRNSVDEMKTRRKSKSGKTILVSDFAFNGTNRRKYTQGEYLKNAD